MSDDPKPDVEMKDAAEDAKETAEPEKPNEPEKPKEPEEDTPEDSRPKLSEKVVIHPNETTLDVLPTVNGKVLTRLNDGGFQFLLSGARSNVGLQAGRYAYEVKLLEHVASQATQQGHSKTVVKVGFTTRNGSLLMCDSCGFCFDAEGFFVHNKSRTKVATSLPRIVKGDTISLFLNLTAHTASLFKNGARVCDPQPLPESLKGKTLYPTVCFQNVSLIVNFGPQLSAPLPFVARSIQEAASADCETIALPADGAKYQVLFPVGMPDSGAFDWVDQFLEKNPSFSELSDRKIIEWATSSGLHRQGGKEGSNDSPVYGFNTPAVDGGGVRKMLAALAPTLKRNLVVMELASNLQEESRHKSLQQFASSHFEKVAHVVMGEPTSEFKEGVHAMILAKKQSALDLEHAKKKAEEQRKKALEKKKKAAEAAKALAKKKAELALKKAQKARQKKIEAAKKKKEAQEKGLEIDDAEEEAAESEEEEMVEEAPPEEPEEEEKDEGPAVAELTEEEKAMKFRSTGLPDLTQEVMTKSYSKFSIPQKSEGFDDVRFAWDSEAQCTTFLKDWVLKNKLLMRVEGLEPSDWFKEKQQAFQKFYSELKKKQLEFKQKGKVTKKKVEGEEEKKEEDADAETANIDPDEVDCMSVEDIDDINKKGRPLYAEFAFEDNELLTIRYELHLLVHAFQHDVDDPDRPGMTAEHLAHYFNLYYKKHFNLKTYGFTELKPLVALLKDTLLTKDPNEVLGSKLDIDTPLENFVKMTEEHRRERQRRIDAGDETAKLKFVRGAPSAQGGRPQPPGTAPPRPAGSPSNKGGGGGGRYSGGARANYYGSAAPTASYSAPSGGVKRYAPPSNYPPSQRPRYGGGKGGAPMAPGGYRR